ncbi:C3HC zinc finger-like-domain-containing protein [Amylocarpus encephaloides]|uniref:C3HC zinc finger-like-domain-containing protein n=1 Tax=Amylocarpus encephaloides TaxID=45428 RepID=A0A9P7YTI9_9HELO|nr:C3HC zinc finger-like-domain-containing protein [Amylocarpus encephaloides]
MHATKRKFNALLNGIGNKSTTSLSSKEINNASQTDLTSTTSPDSQSKKRRTSTSTSTASVKACPPKTIATKLSAAPAMSHRKSASVATTPLTTESPKYAPWDRLEFLKRLKSFSNLTNWAPKPARVNEVEWAKRGWVCQKSERVRCCLCNVEIVVKVNVKELEGEEKPVYVEDHIEATLVDRYAEMIVASHDEDCLWRQRGCDDSIFKLPLSHTPTTIQDLRDRYDELYTRAGNLPYTFNIQTPPDFNLDTIISYLPKNFFSSPSTNDPPDNGTSTSPTINEVAFEMALFGWQGHIHERLGPQPGSISCHACFRVLGLWLFKSKEVSPTGEELIGPIVASLDPLQEHRDYCPWRNSFSQTGTRTPTKSGSTPLPGWEMVVRILKNDDILRTGKKKSANGGRLATPVVDNGSDFGSIMESVEDDAKSRDERDKERWARLRRVKSLFDTKGGKKVGKGK